MKKFVNYGLGLMLMASLFLVTSCGEDPVETVVDAPTVTLPAAAGTERTVDVGEEVAFTVNVTAPGVFNTFIVTQTIGNTTTEIEREGRASGTAPATYEYDFSFTPAAEHAGQEIIFDFVAVDDNNKENKATYTVIVNEAAAIAEYETVLLGGQLNNTEKSFFNAVDGQKLGYTEANSNPAKVDFLYYFQRNADGTGTHATIGAPADEPTRTFWNNTKNSSGNSLTLSEEMTNATSFKRMPANYDYAAVVNGNQLANAYLETAGASDAGTRITNLEVGQSFAFMLDEARGGRYGLVQVTNIEGSDGSNRTITLNVKVQSENNN